MYTLHTSCHLGPQWQAPSHSVPKMDKDNITPGNCPCARTRRDARSTPSHADRYRHTGTNVCVHQDRSSLTVTGRRTLSQAQRMTCGHTNTPAEQHVQARSSTGRDTLTHRHSRCPFPNMHWHSEAGRISHGSWDGSEPASPDAACSRAGRPPPPTRQLSCGEPGRSGSD